MLSYWHQVSLDKRRGRIEIFYLVFINFLLFFRTEDCLEPAKNGTARCRQLEALGTVEKYCPVTAMLCLSLFNFYALNENSENWNLM